VLLLVWVLVVLIAPSTAPYVAAQVQPVRDFALIDKEKYRVELEEEERFEKEWEAWEKANQEAADNVRSSAWPAMKRDQFLRLIDQQDKIDDQFLKQMDGQIRLGQYLSRLSPLSCFAYAASDLAGAGIADHHRFRELLPEYRRQITRFGFATRVEAALNDSWDERTIEGYPRFQHQERPLADRVSWIDILFLGIWNVLFFMGAYLSFLRYDAN
jgi:hypothetical protein